MTAGRLTVGAGLLGLGVGAYARMVAVRRFEITSAEIRSAGWPATLDGARIGVLGDVHLGTRRGRRWPSPALEQAVEAMNTAQLDLLVLVGDFGYWQWDPKTVAGEIDRFRAAVRVAVFGNHDYAHGSRRATELREALERRGIQVLVNEATAIRVGDEPVTVAGLGDLHSRRTDVDKLTAALDDMTHPVILLSHTPDAVEMMPGDSFDVAFSGHTHGGQLAVPLLKPFALRRFARSRFDRGVYDIDGRPLFVTKGLGMVGLHARFRSRPEIAVITLRPAAVT